VSLQKFYLLSFSVLSFVGFTILLPFLVKSPYILFSFIDNLVSHLPLFSPFPLHGGILPAKYVREVFISIRCQIFIHTMPCLSSPAHKKILNFHFIYVCDQPKQKPCNSALTIHHIKESYLLQQL